ncbi:MAG: hypothetical protein GWN13_29425, partial [Phycisphaerae bacterium]|nr:hypothetical protein [Phycisphaerae bacterium]
KVNPHEVEAEIRRVPGVRDVLVKARQNRLTGNILVAEVVPRSAGPPRSWGSPQEAGNSGPELERSILQHLQQRLQVFKIPRIIKFVPELDMTRTGKKVRS